MKLRWAYLDRFADLGYLVMRVGVGALFTLHHGWPILFGGPDEWASTGRAVGYLSIHFGYAMWGFFSALIMVLGGIALALGSYFRPAALLLAITMAVAAIWKYYPFHDLDRAAYAIALFCVCLGFFFMGAGKLSLEEKM